MNFLIELSLLLVNLLPIGDFPKLVGSVCLIALKIIIDELRK